MRHDAIIRLGADCRRRQREFVGTERQAAGFTVSIEGVQRENGMCRRSASVWRPS
ncbi:hypothetical protein [Mycobacterium avium]